MVRTGRRLAVGAAAALVVGVLCGGVARVMMRLVTVASEQEGTFSFVGTAGIMVVFAVFALPGTLLAALTARRWRWVLLALGAVALCIPTTGIAESELTAVGQVSGLEILSIGGAVIGVYLSVLAIPFVGLAAVDRWPAALSRRAGRIDASTGAQGRPRASLSSANR